MKFIFSLLIILSALTGFSQSRLQVVADTVKVADAELVIRNSTRNISGFLYNAGNGKTKFVELGKSVQFTVGDLPQLPQAGDTLYTSPDLIGRNIKVWKNGLFQYRRNSQGIKVDSVAGTIIFKPALQNGDLIYVEALLGVNLVAYISESSENFETNLKPLNAGIFSNGQNFTLRWTTNQKTLTDSPRVVGLGSSTLAGQGLQSPNRLGDKIQAWMTSNSTGSFWNNLAVSGYSSINLLPAANGGNASSNIEAALSYNPDFIFISLPSNDATGGLTVTQSMANYRAIDRLAAAKGVPVFWGTTQPRNSTVEVQQRLKDLADSIRAAWPDKYVESFIDLFDASAGTPAAANPQYLQPDGIHFTSDGNQFVANRLFTRWSAYFQPIIGVRSYTIQKSSDSLNWADFDVVTNPDIVRKAYTRSGSDSAYFRVKANYTNGGSSAYSNAALLPKAVTPEENWAQAKRVLIELGGDGVSITEGKPVSGGVDSLGKYWNGWFGMPGLGFRSGAEKQGLVTTTNENTVMSVKLIGNPYGTFGVPNNRAGMNFNGLTEGMEDYPWEALADNMFVHYSALDSTTLRIKGLQRNATYRIKIVGARVDAVTTPRILQARLSRQAPWVKEFNGRYAPGEAPDPNKSLLLDSITGVDSVDINLRASVTNGVGHVSLLDIKMLDYQSVLQTGIEYNDMTVTMPTSSVQPTGTVIIPGTVAYYSWAQVSGPSQAIITNGSLASPTISELTNGEYVFRVVANFAGGQQAFDDMKVTVYPDNDGKKTMRVHFSAAAATPIPGWLNLYGAPNLTPVFATDPVTGWRVASDSTGGNYWKPISGGNSGQDGLGEFTGNNSGIVPDIALRNYWFNSERPHSSRYNIQISGLDSTKRYTIKIVGSRDNTTTAPRTSAYYLKGDTTRYLLNAFGNTSNATVLTNIAPINNSIFLDIATAQPETTYPGEFGAYSYLNALIIQEE